MQVIETTLADFRRDHLAPEHLLLLLLRYVWMLVQLGIGVGKSYAIDALLAHPPLYEQFDLVLYVAPAWNVINERQALVNPGSVPVPFKVIEPRPIKLCGAYNREWSDLEQRGCAAYAKSTICSTCRETVECDWPEQLQRIKGTGLIFTTEQQLLINRSLIPMLKARTKAKSVLVILDEAKFIDGCFRIEIARRDLQDFLAVLEELVAARSRASVAWAATVRELLACPPSAVASFKFNLPPALLYQAERMQRLGVERFGKRFRFVGYDLLQLMYSRSDERQLRMDGTLGFTARPYLNAHVLIASAHLDANFVGQRLGDGPVPAPFSDVVVRHTGTRIYNLRARLGAESFFSGNKKQILDTFSVILRRNVLAGRSTILICRQKSKAACAVYLAERLAGWGLEVRFVVDGSVLPLAPDPSVVPVIHYGILGVNDYTAYESALCVMGYYVAEHTLIDALAEHEPTVFGCEVRIVTHGTYVRRVELVRSEVPDIDRTWLANLYLHRMEVDPVIQAAGRVRFLTMPREVVFFQMADLSKQLGNVVEVRTLAALRAALGVPSAKAIDHDVAAGRLRAGIAEGLTVEQAAVANGMSRRTAFRVLGQSAKIPLRDISIRGFGTPDGLGGAP